MEEIEEETPSPLRWSPLFLLASVLAMLAAFFLVVGTFLREQAEALETLTRHRAARRERREMAKETSDDLRRLFVRSDD